MRKKYFFHYPLILLFDDREKIQIEMCYWEIFPKNNVIKGIC
jgi:hypothetical protein